MRKIAFMSDIHSNLTALKAVMLDIKERNISEVICLGDIVGKGPRPNECIDIVRNSCVDVIKGNLEVSIIHIDPNINGRWNRNCIDKDRINYLDSLKINNTIIVNNHKIYYTHAFSDSGYTKDILRPTEQDDIPFVDADIVIYADIHHQYAKKTGKQLVLNTGSVGNPILNKHNQIQNTEVKAEYLVLKISELDIDFEFVQVDYDKKGEIEFAKKIKLPLKEKYITEITTGKYIKV